MWDWLEFRIAGTHAHVFSGSSDGNSLIVTARADLDCDGVPAEMRLTCILPDGAVDCVITQPLVIE